MRVLVACEWSGVVRDAFLRKGHEAVSCDLLPTFVPGPHVRGDVRHVEMSLFDLLIAFPPCTYLSISGARWFPGRDPHLQAEALAFVRWLLGAPVARIALENPIGVISTRVRKPDQIVQPWWFGESERKSTCLWLKNLPPLIPTKIVDKGVHHVTSGGRRIPQSYSSVGHSAQRSRRRGRTCVGMAEAMAEQWG